jgi:histone H3/H4
MPRSKKTNETTEVEEKEGTTMIDTIKTEKKEEGEEEDTKTKISRVPVVKKSERRNEKRDRTTKINIGHIRKGTLRRLMRRNGVFRVSKSTCSDMQQEADKFLGGLMKDSCAYARYHKRKTVMAIDIVLALKRRTGKQVIGCGV